MRIALHPIWRLLAVLALVSASGGNAAHAQQQGPQLVVQAGHTLPINAVAFDSTNKILASASNDGTVKVWDIASGSLLRTLTGHTDGVNSVAIRPDGQWLASGGEDGTVRLWDPATGALIRTLTGSAGGVLAVAFSPDGQWVAGGGHDGHVRIWDAATGRVLRVIAVQKAPYLSLAFRPDGLALAVITENDAAHGLSLWDLDTGKRLLAVPDVGPAAFSHDGKHLAFLRADLSAVMIDADGSGPRRILQTGAPTPLQFALNLKSLAFSADDATLVAAAAKRLLSWDAATGALGRDAPNDVAAPFLSPDARLLAGTASVEGEGVSADDVAAVLTIRDANTGVVLSTLAGHSAALHALAFAPDGKALAVASEDPTVKLWDMVGGGEARRFGGAGKDARAVTTLAFSPDGHRLTSGGMDATVRAWDQATGRAAWHQDANASSVDSVTVSPDGRLLADGGWHGTVTLRRAATGAQIRLLTGHYEHEWNEVAFSPDSRHLAATGDDGALVVWNVAGGKPRVLVAAQKGEDVSLDCALAWSPDGRQIAYGSPSGAVVFYDAATGRKGRVLPGRATGVADIIYSPDRKVLAVSGKRVTLWDTATGRPLRVLPSEGESVGALAFHPAGKTLAGNTGAATLLWDWNAGRELCRLLSFTNGSWVVVAPDGRFDTDNLDDLSGLHWVLPDAPYTALLPEVFLRQFYEPRLLPRLLTGEPLPPVPSLTDLNRVQPTVTIIGVSPHANDQATVDVTVEASGTSGTFRQNGQAVTKTTGVYDLRLFRDGQLVGALPAVEENDAPVDLTASGKLTHTFTVRLARDGRKSVDFSAYAFNVDRIKSPTARLAYAPPNPLTIVKGRAYVIALGANTYEDSAWNLRFAAPDARRMLETLGPALTQTDEFERVVTVPLISDGNERGATKAALQSVIDQLAGRPTTAHTDGLKKANPEDFVLLTFSCHGDAERQGGDFYLFPSDIGPNQRQGLTLDLKSHAVSSRELSEWLRDVDADRIALVVDSCHSAASIDSGGFKPGPMGSRGLGQLAYDKGLRFLAASQADDVALESDALRDGLLTYALVHEGLACAQAAPAESPGAVSLAQWLRYGVARVPSLAAEVRAGKVQSFGRGPRAGWAVVDDDVAPAKARPAQQPALFDFTHGQHDILIRQSAPPDDGN